MRLPSFLNTSARWMRSALALGGLSLFSGCLWLDGHQSTIQVEGPVAKSQTNVFYVTCWVTLVVFVIVASVLAYASIKFKARTPEEEKAIPPDQGHGNPFVEVGLIGASVLALVIIAFPTLRAIWYTYDVPEAEKENTYVVNATGLQWWWKFEYPNEQIKDVGPLQVGNELVIPAGRPVHINLRAADVIHSFWIPKLAGKVDMIPNRGNHLWLKADAPGYYWGQCAEYCGDSHAVMRFRVIALGPKEFAEWVDQQSKSARTLETKVAQAAQPKAQFASYKTWKRNEPGYTAKYDVAPLDAWREHQFPVKDEDPVLIAHGREIFKAKNCITCHTVRGHDGVGMNAPDLTHVGSRTTIAGGLLENNPEQLARWIMHPDQVKPGNKMYVGVNGMAGYVTRDIYGAVQKTNITVNEEEAHALVAYLTSLK